MNDKQFEALLEALNGIKQSIDDSTSSIESELMILRDQLFGLTDAYCVANGLDTESEARERLKEHFKNGTLFDPEGMDKQ
jgi:hypothetical protein